MQALEGAVRLVEAAPSLATAVRDERREIEWRSVAGILPEDIDSANPIAEDRCASARLDYLALGDWHGFKQVNERCAYSGTPEQDRFRGNEPGYCLVVEVEAGQPPKVEPVRVGRFHWHQREYTVAVESDIDLICTALAEFGADDIAQVRIDGRTDLAGHRRLTEALAQAHALMRSLAHDTAYLRLLPTAEDIAALRADGYLAEVIADLQDAQRDGAPESQARVAREALAILCSELDAANAAPL
ncbi:MAG TPA: hypothetical protein PK177_14785 [Burkholderiaceae bacterium]|nr:hypothetical protein [Burkholderiaceae bacterium]